VNSSLDQAAVASTLHAFPSVLEEPQVEGQALPIASSISSTLDIVRRDLALHAGARRPTVFVHPDCADRASLTARVIANRWTLAPLTSASHIVFDSLGVGPRGRSHHSRHASKRATGCLRSLIHEIGAENTGPRERFVYDAGVLRYDVPVPTEALEAHLMWSTWCKIPPSHPTT